MNVATDAFDSNTRRVLITWPDYDVSDPDLGGALIAAGCELRLAPKLGARSPEELAQLLDGASAAIVSTDPFTAAVLAEADALKVIARVGVGVDSIDLAAAESRGVKVTTTPGANDATVADHTIGMMLAVLRRIAEHDQGVRSGAWNRTGSYAPQQLSHRTVGLVGYGRIGQAVARRLQGFDVRILICDPGGLVEGKVPLLVLLKESDVVSLHCPLTPETRHLIGARELAAMKSNAVIINTARGGVVDEEALSDALAAGSIAGAGLDVFESEPPEDSIIVDAPNVVLSPHIAALSDTSIGEMTRRATQSVLAVLRGDTPSDLLRPQPNGRAAG